MRMGRIEIDTERCKGCSLCVPACPKGIIQMAAGFNTRGYHPAQLVDPEGKCTGCMLCAVMCPEGAIVVYRVERPRVRRAEMPMAA
jgi:2-oxoglutarate ferredoxin oxidoreductase subunit delta